MKKLALTNLIVLMAIKSVSACTYLGDPLAEDKSFYSTMYFFSLATLILTNVVIYYWRRKGDVLSLIFILSIAVIMTPVTFFGVLMEYCDLLGETLKLEFIVFVAITVFHIGLWITKSSFPTWQTEKGKMISLKLE